MKSNPSPSSSRLGAKLSSSFVIVCVALTAFAAAAADTKKPAARDLPALFSTFEKTDAVVEGSTSPKRVLYVFFDANCWYCHLAWKALQPHSSMRTSS